MNDGREKWSQARVQAILDMPLEEAATIKAQMQGLLKTASSLLQDKNLPKNVREDIGKLRDKLKKRWKEIENSDDDDAQESTVMELADFSGSLREAEKDTEGHLIPIVVIRAGKGNVKDRRYYPATTLERDFGVFEGRKMFLDHPTMDEEYQRPERSLKDFVGNVRNVRYNSEKEQVEANAEIHLPWFEELVERAKSEIKVSINAIGKTTPIEIENEEWFRVEEIIAARSVDFVTEAGAGGEVRSLHESYRVQETLSGVSLEELETARPDLLVKFLERGIDDLSDDVRKELTNKMSQEDIKALQEKNVELEKKNNDLAERLVRIQRDLLVREAREGISTLVKASSLPDFAQARVVESIRPETLISDEGAIDQDKLEEVTKAAITKESEYLSKIQESKVRFPGTNRDGDDTDTMKEARAKLFRALGYDDKEIEELEKLR